MKFQEETVAGYENPAYHFDDNSTRGRPSSEPPHIHNDAKIIIEPKRAQWDNGVEFLMSCIAMSVGLGNIWRFPFTAYENGGGAFLIPYIIVLMVIGRPIYYMEMALGQFTSRGNVQMFASLAPAMKGVGYGQLLGVICIATYYCSLMAVTLFYLINSFTGELPWAECRPEWTEGLSRQNVTCVPSNAKNPIVSENSRSSSELYFTKEVLKEATSIDRGIGTPEWRLSLLLLAAWTCTFFVSRRGVKSSGKAAYFLALFPYVIMIALLVRAVTLDGAADGILFFIAPDWNKLFDANVWYAAVTQCFFSLNVGFGTIVMYSSYNNFEHNINRDALVVTTLDTLTSVLAGATIFGILGNLAHEMGTDVDEVINSGGSGLAFISYPEAIAKFESVPWLFAILFFVMLFVLGIGSLVALHGCVITVITDAFPKLKKWQVSLGTAIAGFLLGLVYVTPGGQFILNMVDHFGGTFVIFVLAIVEMVTVMWWYGMDNFCTDIEFMIKQKVGVYWRVCWGLLTPVLLIVIFAYFVITLPKLQYAGQDYPTSALVCGWMILAAAVVLFVYFIAKALIANRDEKTWRTVIAKSFDSSEWGPADPQRREEYRKFKELRRSEALKSASKWKRFVSHFIGRRST